MGVFFLTLVPDGTKLLPGPELLSIGPSGTNLGKLRIKLQKFSFNTRAHLKGQGGKKALESIVCKLSAILFGLQYQSQCQSLQSLDHVESLDFSWVPCWWKATSLTMDNNSQAMPILVRQHLHIDGLVQERCNSSALAMDLSLSCANPSIWVWSWRCGCLVTWSCFQQNQLTRQLHLHHPAHIESAHGWTS